MTLQPRSFPARHIQVWMSIMLWALEMLVLEALVLVGHVLYAPVRMAQVAASRVEPMRSQMVSRLQEHHERAQTTVAGSIEEVRRFLLPDQVAMPAGASANGARSGKPRKRSSTGTKR